MKFNYQARTKTGEIQTGVVEASSKDAAFSLLKSHGFYVTALEEFAPPFYARKLKIFEKVGPKDVVIFSRQLAVMFKSRVPLVEIFQTLSRQTGNQSFREAILKIAEEVEGGTSLSGALALYPKIFSSFYINMVKSGEISGKLSDTFSYLAVHLEREHNFRGKIKGAMIYPIFVLVVFVAVIVILLTYVIPQLGEVLKESGQGLPLITQTVLAMSAFLRSRGWVVLLALILLAVLFWRFVKTERGKDFFDRSLLKWPLLGSFLKKVYLTRSALNLSSLVSGGLPIARALEITGQVVGNNVFKEVIFESRDGVKSGEAISSTLAKHPQIISPFFYQMVVVGEKTGTLDSSLTNVVDFYQSEIDRTLDAFIKILEPSFIILLGLVVGGLMAAVLIPIYSIEML